MNADWHEQIQRCMTGDATPEEIAALQAALNDDAELRALYLDYMNLDAALGAAAETAAITENETGRITAFFPRPSARLSPRYWGWLAATAACAALIVFSMLPKHRNSVRVRPDIVAAISATESAIARLSVEPPSLFPAWASPTASLLDQPRIP